MTNNIDWDIAVASAQCARYVYLDWDTCNYNIQVNVTKSFQTHIQIFDNSGAQGIGFYSELHDIYFISFRGTHEWSDIIADVRALYYDTKHGSVHTGFANELNKLSLDIKDWISINGSDKHSKIVVTGHSLGAGMATLLYARLLDQQFSNVSLYTFGSPKVGTLRWTENINKNHNIYRFVNNNDIVPHTPPSRLYHHLAGSMYIMYSGEVTSNLTTWERWRDKILSRLKAMSKFQMFDGIYDHSMPRYLKKIERYAITKK